MPETLYVSRLEPQFHNHAAHRETFVTTHKIYQQCNTRPWGMINPKNLFLLTQHTRERLVIVVLKAHVLRRAHNLAAHSQVVRAKAIEEIGDISACHWKHEKVGGDGEGWTMNAAR